MQVANIESLQTSGVHILDLKLRSATSQTSCCKTLTRFFKGCLAKNLSLSGLKHCKIVLEILDSAVSQDATGLVKIMCDLIHFVSSLRAFLTFM